MTVCGNSLLRSLLGAKRTWLFALHMSANDPKRTFLLCKAHPNSCAVGADPTYWGRQCKSKTATPSQ